MNIRLYGGILMLVVWAVVTVTMEAPGYVHLLLVFGVFLLIWGWMWGIAGAALAVPILAMLKIGCDRFECTRPVGTLLGG